MGGGGGGPRRGIRGVHAENPHQRVLLSWGRSIVGGMYRGQVPQMSPHAQVWASCTLILPRSRTCSDQNGMKYAAFWRLDIVCFAGWVYPVKAEIICRESSARASRSQSCCLQAARIDWLPHDSERVARSSMIVFTPPHRVAMVRGVGGSEDAKVFHPVLAERDH